MSRHYRQDLFDAFVSSIASGAGCPSHAYLLDEMAAAIGCRDGSGSGPFEPRRTAGSTSPLTRAVAGARIWLSARIGSRGSDGVTGHPQPKLSLW